MLGATAAEVARVRQFATQMRDQPGTQGEAMIQQMWAKETWLMWQHGAGEATTVAHSTESGQCHPGVAD